MGINWNSDKYLLLMTVVLLVTSTSLLGYLQYQKNKTQDYDFNDPRARPIPEYQTPDNDQRTEMYQRGTFLDHKGFEHELGVTEPYESSPGERLVSIYAHLSDFRVEDDSYKLYLSLKEYNSPIIVNLGSANSRLYHLYSEYDPDTMTLPRRGEIITFGEVNKLTNPREFYNLYNENNLGGTYIRVELFLSIPELSPDDNCDRACKEFIQTFERHRVANNSFINNGSLNSQLGAVSLVSFSK